jgi:hypothetical protein
MSIRAGISQTHAGDQQLVGQITLVLAFQLGQLDLAVDAQHFPLAFGLRGAHRQAFGHRQRDDVGQVVLALGIVVLQFAQPVGQTGRRNGHDAGIDLTDGLLLGRRILFLDDADHVAGGVTDDAAVAGRVGKIDRQHRQPVLASLQQALQRGHGGQRHVAVKDQCLRGTS